MENKYLEKLANNEQLHKDMDKPWTTWGQRDALKRHGYDVNMSDMRELNFAAGNKDPIRTLKHTLGAPLAGAAIGGIAGHLLGRNSGAGSLIGGGVGLIDGFIRESKAIKKDYHSEIDRRIDSGLLKKASDNTYLEKIAGWRSKLEQVSGKSFAGSNNAEVLAGLGQSSKMNSIASGDKVGVRKGVFGLGGTTPASQGVATGRTIQTGDAFAKGDLAKRLSTFKEGKAKALASAAPKGFLERAVGFAKKNPLATAGLALAGGVMAGKHLGQNQQQQQPSYGYM